jgi:hypothetical protein
MMEALVAGLCVPNYRSLHPGLLQCSYLLLPEPPIDSLKFVAYNLKVTMCSVFNA